MNRWNGKHPIPHDFFFTFDNTAGEDLSWFWNPWFFEYGYPDLGISNLVQDEQNVSVTVNKIGNLPTKVEVTFEFENGESKKFTEKANIWKEGNKNYILNIETSEMVKKVVLGNKYIPDINEENNIIDLSSD